jgi:hypothetical protein
MAKQAADHHKKAAEQHDQAAHQHKQTRRAMRRTNRKKDAPDPPRAWLQAPGDPSWDGRGEVPRRRSWEYVAEL